MNWIQFVAFFFVFLCLISTQATHANNDQQQQQSPESLEGYYAFVESPNAEPPRVRGPPYTFTSIECRDGSTKSAEYTLCGDLNKGTIPKNPMGQDVLGSPYPFELMRNMTLKFLSKTLPILKADETLPKVAQIQDDLQNTINSFDGSNRVKRALHDVAEDEESREGRKFCDQGGIFCMLYKAINGEASVPSSSGFVSSSGGMQAERRDDGFQSLPPKYEGPPTPCPAKVEYATPVFAKNYQGVWRYVVQIPYEGYFTQTVEVTRCLQSRCHYLDGGCLSSPRWTSLLVAEIYYPDAVLSSRDTVNPPRAPVSASQPPSVQDFQNYQQYLHKRAGLAPNSETPSSTSTARPTHCDGVDALGCFQVRLYYDWFLIPGSCKCWRPDYFNKYVRKQQQSQEL